MPTRGTARRRSRPTTTRPARRRIVGNAQAPCRPARAAPCRLRRRAAGRADPSNSRLEETEIIVQLPRAAAGHPFGQGNRGRQAGGVLVDVKRPIEMRDAEAFDFQLRIDGEIRPEVRFQQLAVFALEAIDRQRLARFGQRVRDLLELGEHRLPQDRAADGVDLAIDQERPLAIVLPCAINAGRAFAR